MKALGNGPDERDMCDPRRERGIAAQDAAIPPERGSVLYFTTLCLIAALGGFLFGFDTAVISGAVGFIEQQFQLDAMALGWVVSSALVGCIVGSAGGGWLADRFGRKTVLILSGLLFVFTAAGCAVAMTPGFLTFSRLVGGIAVGVSGMVVPLYIAEISPPHLRGRMISGFQLAITVGILAAYFSNALLGKLPALAADSASLPAWCRWMFVDEVWRAMFGSLLLPSAAFVLLLLLVPESPRWLAKRGRQHEALAILGRIVGRDMARREIIEIAGALQQERADLGQLFRAGPRRALLMAVFLAVSAQVSGINAIIYYGPRILESAGFQLGSAMGRQVILGIVNVVFTVLAMWKVDTMGRRPLLLAGSAGMFAALAMTSGFFAAGMTEGVWLVLCLCAYLACFSFSLGPLPWVFMSEVFPTRIRGQAMSIATLSLWAANTAVCQTFPWLTEHLGPAGTFAIYAALVCPVLVLAGRFMPETKGRSLEELERLLGGVS